MTNITHSIVKISVILIAGVLSVSAAAAQGTLPLPQGTVETAKDDITATQFMLPIGPWAAPSGVPAQMVAGHLSRNTYILKKTSLSAFEILAPMQRQLEMDGFDILFQCQGRECGGFDYRNSAPIAKPPEMFLDLRNFATLSAVATKTGDAVFIVSSVFSGDGYIQVDQISDDKRPSPTVAQLTALPTFTGSIAEQLTLNERAILGDLEFQSGSSKLDQKPFASLQSLAEFIKATPNVSIFLVGHSDMVGGMDGNMALSRNRAKSVRERLITEFDIDGTRLSAYGVGFLSPISSNSSPEGRDQNRRVEAIVKHDPK